MAHRVVVTGWGVLSSIGHTAEHLLVELCARRLRHRAGDARSRPTSSRRRWSPRSRTTIRSSISSERQLPPMDRVAQFGVVAAREAIAHSGLSFDGGLAERTATIIGCGGRRAIDPGRELQAALWRKRQAAASADHSQADGECAGEPDFHDAADCAARRSWWRAPARRRRMRSGWRFRWCARAPCRCAVTGGAEACIAFGTMKGWEALRVLAPDTCRPFSRDRKGW